MTPHKAYEQIETLSKRVESSGKLKKMQKGIY
jgi:hypothetical protein